MGWIGVDLDGTLARCDGWLDIEHIGDPVPAMLERVKQWLADGIEVRIVTARVSGLYTPYKFRKPTKDAQKAQAVVEAWCQKHLGRKLPVTCIKDFAMLELWDDRAIRVETNTGKVTVSQNEPKPVPA